MLKDEIDSARFYTEEARRRIESALSSPELEIEQVQELISIDGALRGEVERLKILLKDF